MDGFKLLEHIGLELDLPVISEFLAQLSSCLPMWSGALQIDWCACAVMSSNGETSVVLRGVTHGAVDFLIKPVRVEELKNVWQHVVRRRQDQVQIHSLYPLFSQLQVLV